MMKIRAKINEIKHRKTLEKIINKILVFPIISKVDISSNTDNHQ